MSCKNVSLRRGIGAGGAHCHTFWRIKIIVVIVVSYKKVRRLCYKILCGKISETDVWECIENFRCF